MIYGFVRQSDGQVRIHSQVGVGTTMPCCSREPADECKFILPETPRAVVGETVLVVDDEATVRMLAVEVLEDLGYRAIEAPEGAGGLKILRSDFRIDLLVTDVGLPGSMNGRQLADAGRVLRPELKVLFITGYAEAAVLDQGAFDMGMHVMTKPFSMNGPASRIKGVNLSLGAPSMRCLVQASMPSLRRSPSRLNKPIKPKSNVCFQAHLRGRGTTADGAVPTGCLL